MIHSNPSNTQRIGIKRIIPIAPPPSMRMASRNLIGSGRPLYFPDSVAGVQQRIEGRKVQIHDRFIAWEFNELHMAIHV